MVQKVWWRERGWTSQPISFQTCFFTIRLQTVKLHPSTPTRLYNLSNVSWISYHNHNACSRHDCQPSLASVSLLQLLLMQKTENPPSVACGGYRQWWIDTIRVPVPPSTYEAVRKFGAKCAISVAISIQLLYSRPKTTNAKIWANSQRHQSLEAAALEVKQLAVVITETVSCDKGGSLAFRISLELVPSHSRFK